MPKITYSEVREILENEHYFKSLLIPKKENIPSPKKETLQTIFEYSRSLTIMETDCLGSLEVILN